MLRARVGSDQQGAYRSTRNIHTLCCRNGIRLRLWSGHDARDASAHSGGWEWYMEGDELLGRTGEMYKLVVG